MFVLREIFAWIDDVRQKIDIDRVIRACVYVHIEQFQLEEKLRRR